jgi:polyisoprenyl-teichoic acid--peptidoglycan teichoic acid transferase
MPMVSHRNTFGRHGRHHPTTVGPHWLLGALLSGCALTLATGCLLSTAAPNLVSSFVATNSPNLAAGGGASATTVAATSVPAWSGTQRVTFLLMGMDRADGISSGPNHTDSMMLVSVDPISKTVVLLSIPRDLWVQIPGYGSAKITEANFDGDAYGYPGGGSALAVKTVEQNLGIHVDHYVRIDFNAFETFIDAIGGIDVNVPETIDDPTYPDANFGYEPFYLPAGPQHLNGHDALRYARTRHSGQGDLDRARRQQQVVMAVRDRVLNLNLLPTLMLKAPLLYQSLLDDVKMDLSLNEILSLALLGPQIPKANITSVVIDYNDVTDATTADGQEVLMPIPDKIRALRDSLFPAAGVDDVAQVTAEGASVEVLNGAGVSGLAQATADWLRAQGINVVAVGTADRPDYLQTEIMDDAGKPYTSAWLARTFHVLNVSTNAFPGSTADIKIILGQDWSVPVSGSSTH